jgi:prepilin-type N-terminal cleavage/methylation domain-containing protein/prepilin-type processing-associated H-X9-DG protein
MKTQNAKRKSERGFTLTELVATVVVICCLILVAIPAFAKSEGRGLTTACRNNLRLMMSAFHMYADENNSYFPGNEGITSQGLVWISDNSDFANPPMTNYWNPRNNLLAPYLPWKQNVMRCPADLSVVIRTRDVPRPRSISMNHAVGTKGTSGAQRAPVDGGWLDGNFGHTANSRFYCYGKLSDIVAPTPAGLWIFIEEHPDSINDGAFGNVGPLPPNQYRMIDYPGAWHDGAAMLSFADGHVEERKWVDARTVPARPFVTQTSQLNNPDITWLANRTTAAVPR